MAVDTLGHLLAVHVTPANEQEHAQVLELCDAVQTATGQNVKLAWADQGYTGEQPRQDAKAHGIKLQVIKLAEAKKGFVLLPRRWVVERSFAWAARFRLLSRDYERLPDVLRGWHFVVFAILMLPKVVPLLMAARSSQHALGVRPKLPSIRLCIKIQTYAKSINALTRQFFIRFSCNTRLASCTGILCIDVPLTAFA